MANDFSNEALWYSTKRAAEFLGLAPMTLHNYRHHAKGPTCEQDGRRWYYRVDELTAWDNARRTKSNAKATAKAARKPRKGAETRAAA